MRALILALALTACAPENAYRYHTAENEEEVISLLNQREFAKAIWLIENREGRSPKGTMGYLLAQAYLGKAEFEPLAFAARVSEPEPSVPEAEAIFPRCPKERISSARQVEMRCLLKRVYLHAPPVDNPDFNRARQLLRSAYPDPASSPEWVNTLIGMVETVSLVRRAGDLFVYSRKAGLSDGRIRFNPTDVRWLQAQGRESMNEAREALARANHAGEKVSRFLSTSKANEWFERVEGTMEFAKAVGLSRFLDFVRENLLKPTDEIRYGESLDRLKLTLDLLER
jgi:hypothetical protein